MSRINANFETALERIARIMTRKFGINVVIQGNIAATDGKTIWLPMLEDITHELKDDLDGFLDHEVCHCKYTDFEEVLTCKNRFHRELLNAVEDSRIELLLPLEYPGTATNLARLNAKWGAKVATNRSKMPWPIRLILAIRATYDGKKPEVDADFEPLYRRIEAQAKALPKCKNTGELREATAKMIDDINDERRKLAMGESSELDKEDDSGEIMTETPIALNDKDTKAKKKKAKGNAELDPSVNEKKSKNKNKSESDESGEDNEDGEGDNEGDGDEEKSDSQNASKSKKSEQGEEGDEEGDQDGDTSNVDGMEGESKGKSKGEQSDSGSDSEGDEDEDGEGEGESSDNPNKSANVTDKEAKGGKPKEEGELTELQREKNKAKWVELEKHGDMLNEGVNDKPKGSSEFDKHVVSAEAYIELQINKEIEGQPKVKRERGMYHGHDIKEAVSLPVTREFDKVTDYTAKGDHMEYARKKQRVMPMINPIKLHLERVLKVKENARYTFNRERGLINGRALAQVVANDAFRTPFKEFAKTDTTNVAVQLLVDQSGSMSGDKIEVARQAALAIGESLNALGIAFEVTGFQTEGHYQLSSLTSGMTREQIARFNRFGERLLLGIFKRFDSPVLNGITHLHSGGANCDGESIVWAAKRLALRKEKRKIMLVFSDGQPAVSGSDHAILAGDLKRVVRLLPKAGIEVIGFGIQTEDVKLFYPDYVVIEDLQKLPSTVMSKVAKMLEKGIK